MATKEERQAYFDAVVTHLITQNKKASMKDSASIEWCMYRIPDPDNPNVMLKCAAGCMIPDELYNLDMERRNIHALVGEEHQELAPYFPDVNLAMRLQRVHDGSEPSDWYERLDFIACMDGLDTTILQQYKPPDETPSPA